MLADYDKRGPRIPLEKILVQNSTFQTNKLRLRLLNEGIKDHQCEECKREAWNGKPIPLELDHINGVCNDHRIENLRLLCPNCHAQTEHYRGRNAKRNRRT
jgi:5-methylcytosine-specific restriction endonuclease McrA